MWRSEESKVLFSKEARVFSSPNYVTGSSTNTSPISRARDVFSSGLMRASSGAAQLLPSSGVYRK